VGPSRRLVWCGLRSGGKRHRPAAQRIDLGAVEVKGIAAPVPAWQEQEAKLWELRAAVSLARLRRDQGRRAEARDLLAPVYRWFGEVFATP
jgi:predicted ATPase